MAISPNIWQIQKIRYSADRPFPNQKFPWHCHVSHSSHILDIFAVQLLANFDACMVVQMPSGTYGNQLPADNRSFASGATHH
jgi:hypothetical protein